MLKKITAYILIIAMIFTINLQYTFAEETTENEESTDVISAISIDKTLMSEGETATISITMKEGCTARWMYLYKPITKNTVTVYFDETESGVYTGSFEVDEQTESGIWQVMYFTYADENSSYSYLYNSDTYTGSASYDTMDFSTIDFEVIGTNADVTKPILKEFSIDKTLVSSGESVTVSVTIEEDNPVSSMDLYYKEPSSTGDRIKVSLTKVDGKLLYRGQMNIDSETELGIWKPYYLMLSDINSNINIIYNSNIYIYNDSAIDLSALDFEVIYDEEVTDAEQEQYIVIFKDGYGTTLSTQRVAKGESAVEPDEPTNELYLFDGWDKDFSNIVEDTVITAKWTENPDVEYDREIHVGASFKVNVYYTSNQTYTISCNEDIDFESNIVSTGIYFSDKMYYGTEYDIKVNEAGTYLFSVKGSLTSNTHKYKVKVSPHNFSEEWTVDKEATCTEAGSKSHHCTICYLKSSVTVIDALGHDYKEIKVEPTCESQGYTEYKCSECQDSYKENYVDVIEHSWEADYTIDLEPTCEEMGVKSIHCSECDNIKPNTAIQVDAVGHTEVVDEAVAATCTKVGLTEGSHCSECKKVIDKQETLPKKEHEMNKVKVVKEATCEEFGETEQKCLYCDYVIYNTKLPLGHLEGDSILVDRYATTTTDGGIRYLCERCGGSLRSDGVAGIASVELSSYSYVYNGGQKTPNVIVKDNNGNKLIINKHYSVTYSSGRKNIGTYNVVIKFKGAYKGTITKKFKITQPNLSATSKVSVNLYGYDDIKITWKKVSGATGYYIYYKSTKMSSYKQLTSTSKLYYNKSNLSDGIKYNFRIYPYVKINGKVYKDSSYKQSGAIYTLKKIATPKIKKNSKNKVKVSWNNINGETGYQISKSTKKNKTSIVSTYKTTSGKSKVIKVTRKKTYYYKVRAYKTVNGKKIYGPWSSVKKYKLK